MVPDTMLGQGGHVPIPGWLRNRYVYPDTMDLSVDAMRLAAPVGVGYARSYVRRVKMGAEDPVSTAPENADVYRQAYKPGCLPIAVVTLLAALVIGYVGLNSLAGARERARRNMCRSNLNNCINYACRLFAGDYGGHFPPTLGVLYPDYVSDGNVFLCASAGKATAFTRDQFAQGTTLDEYTDYVYVSGLTASDPPKYIVIFDDEGNHAGDGVFVACIGGQVEWLSDLMALYDQLALQEKALAAQGRKMTIIRPPWSKRRPPPGASP